MLYIQLGKITVNYIQKINFKLYTVSSLESKFVALLGHACFLLYFARLLSNLGKAVISVLLFKKLSISIRHLSLSLNEALKIDTKLFPCCLPWQFTVSMGFVNV